MYKGNLLPLKSNSCTLTSVSDISVIYKLTEEHPTVQHARRQKIKLAAQFFSHSTSCAIRKRYELGFEICNATEIVVFVDVINDYFELLNTKFNKYQSVPRKKPFGIDLELQVKFSRDVDNYISSIRVFGGQYCSHSFQRVI